MKDNTYIDELLNGFIDGELTPQQQVELERLIAKEPHIEQKLRELKKCKLLVSSLPFSKAPAGMLGDIKASLEKKALLEHSHKHSVEHSGRRVLLMRKLMTAAAMLVLIVVFGAVIYTIVRPVHNASKVFVAVNNTTQNKPIAAAVESRFDGTLELATKNLTAVKAVINRAIVENGIQDIAAAKNEDGKTVHVLACGRSKLNAFLAEMNPAWGQLDSAKLILKGQENSNVTVDNVNVAQIIEIAHQDTAEKRFELCRNFAFLNESPTLLANNGTLTGEGNSVDLLRTLTPVPKPVLTSAEKTVKRILASSEDIEVNLTIIFNG